MPSHHDERWTIEDIDDHFEVDEGLIDQDKRTEVLRHENVPDTYAALMQMQFSSRHGHSTWLAKSVEGVEVRSPRSQLDCGSYQKEKVERQAQAVAKTLHLLLELHFMPKYKPNLFVFVQHSFPLMDDLNAAIRGNASNSTVAKFNHSTSGLIYDIRSTLKDREIGLKLRSCGTR